MYVTLDYTRKLAQTLLYHENKIKKGKAECILAENFLKDAEDLSHKDKIAHLKRVTSLNAQIKKNTIHVTMNFHPTEDLSNEVMSRIAQAYMKKMGLDQQPYAVFRHHDAAHPHMHLVSTHIQRDGSRVDLWDGLHSQASRIKEELEREFSLQSKESWTYRQTINPGKAQKVVYGEVTVKEAIQNVLNVVFNDYKFTSLDEYNALLKLYNVKADRGREGTKMYKRRGLIYFALDEGGNTKGLPIMASNFYFKPTLHFLEKKFEANKPLREAHNLRVKTAVDWTIHKKVGSMDEFIKELQKERVSAVLQKDKDGVVQGIYYVDHQNKTVFDGAALGEKYRAQALTQRFVDKPILSPEQEQAQRQRPRLNL